MEGFMFAEHLYQKAMLVKRRKPEKFIPNNFWLPTPIPYLRAKLMCNLKKENKVQKWSNYAK